MPRAAKKKTPRHDKSRRLVRSLVKFRNPRELEDVTFLECLSVLVGSDPAAQSLVNRYGENFKAMLEVHPAMLMTLPKVGESVCMKLLASRVLFEQNLSK
jgi:hypothetical protein